MHISLTVSPIKNESGEIVGASKIARDISESKRAQERQKLLLREMDHRVKNLFALAISVVRLSGRSATTVEGAIDTASARLTALASAHALTLSHGSGGIGDAGKPTTLHAPIRAILAPHDAPASDRFSITGSDVEVSETVISGLALLLHEFATNVAKYGALSASSGHVEIDCLDHAGTVNITWSEKAGPAVVPPPDNKGFGDVLIRSTVESLGGEIHRDWRPEGLLIGYLYRVTASRWGEALPLLARTSVASRRGRGIPAGQRVWVLHLNFLLYLRICGGPDEFAAEAKPRRGPYPLPRHERHRRLA